jgi:hypothetical protein
MELRLTKSPTFPALERYPHAGRARAIRDNRVTTPSPRVRQNQ